MIKYSKGWYGIPVLFRWTGTAWAAGVIPGLISAGFGLFLSLYEPTDREISDRTNFLDNPYPFQLFAYLVGFMMVFRTNFAYGRYWEAYDAVQRMGAKWFDCACMAVAFDAPGDSQHKYLKQPPETGRSSGEVVPRNQGPSHEDFFAEIAFLFSLLHALALQYLRCDPCLGNLEESAKQRDFRCSMNSYGNCHEASSSTKPARPGGPAAQYSEATLRKQLERRKLHVLGKLDAGVAMSIEADGQGNPLNSCARVTMVQSWIMRRLIARQKYEPAGASSKTSPPILSRLYQVLSDGHLAFSQAAKVTEVPFPFPYQNLIRIFLAIFIFCAPFVINANVFHVAGRFVVTFMASWAFFALEEVGVNLEDPFLPYDTNELPLPEIQHQFNLQLLSLGVVPARKPVQTTITDTARISSAVVEPKQALDTATAKADVPESAGSMTRDHNGGPPVAQEPTSPALQECSSSLVPPILPVDEMTMILAGITDEAVDTGTGVLHTTVETDTASTRPRPKQSGSGAFCSFTSCGSCMSTANQQDITIQDESTLPGLEIPEEGTVNLEFRGT